MKEKRELLGNFLADDFAVLMRMFPNMIMYL